MKNPAVSVIVAMYNAEKYIGECLTSLANQTFQDFEIIVVDDCSTDNSLNAAVSFTEKFGDRLRIAKLSKNSGHPGVPRNFALEAARGKYVYFLDSDDFLSATALEELYGVAENFDADVVHVDWYISFQKVNGEFEFKQRSYQAGNFVDEPTLETFDIGERVTGFTQKKFLWWACNKLFRRQFLSENEIKFPDVSVFEDFVFAFMCLVAAKNYVRVPFANYCYRLYDDSMSHKTRDAVDSSITAIKIVNTLDNFMDGRKFFHENPQHRYAVLDFFIQERLEVLADKFFVHNEFSLAEVFDFFREKIFSAYPQENVSLTSYLFVAANVLKLCTIRQAEEIDELKRQLAALKK